MFVALSIDLNENSILTRGVVALDDLGDLLHLCNDAVEITCIFEENADIGTGHITNFRWIDNELGSFDDTDINKSLDALVDSGTRDVAFARYLEKRYTCILCDQRKDLLV